MGWNQYWHKKVQYLQNLISILLQSTCHSSSVTRLSARMRSCFMIKVVQPDTLKFFKTIERQKFMQCLKGLAKDSANKEVLETPLKYQIEVWYYRHSFRKMVAEHAYLWDSRIFFSQQSLKTKFESLFGFPLRQKHHFTGIDA